MIRSSPLSSWIRATRRERRGSVWLAALVMASTSVLALTASLGASRASGAFERLREATRASDLYAFVDGGPDGLSDAEVLSRVRSIPGVEAADLYVEVFVSPSFERYFPNFNLIVLARTGASGADWLDRPVIVEGREARLSAADEAVVSESFASELGVDVGDVLALESATSGWVDSTFEGGDGGPPDGPRLNVTVTGIGRTPLDRGQHVGAVFLTPAFASRYSDQIRMYHFAAARFADPSALAALEARPHQDLSGISFEQLEPSYAADEGQTSDALSAIATGWWIVAGLILVAGLVLTLQVAHVAARATYLERSTLHAIGADNRQLATAAMRVIAPAVLLGAAIGVAASMVFSPLASVGLARAIEPHPNRIVVSSGVLAGGAVAMVIAAMIVVVLAVLLAGSRPAARGVRPPIWPRLGRPVPAVVGAREALGRRLRDPGRTTALIAALAIAGMVAAIAVSASILHLRGDPSLTGSTPGRVLDGGESTDQVDQALPFVTSDPRIGFAATYDIFFPNFADGTETTAIAIEVLRGDFSPTILRGDQAIRPDEVVLGPATLETMEVDIGDTIQLLGAAGEPVEYDVVGVGLFPQGDFDFDDGVAMTATGATRVIGEPHDNAQLHGLIFDWAPGIDAARADASVGIDPLSDEQSLAPPPVTNLAQVTGLVRLLAGVFAVMALAALGHLALVTERRQRRDIATLRALGLGRRTGPLSVTAHAITVLAIATIVGVPLGALLARIVWTRLAADAHFVPITTLVPAQQLTALAGIVAAAMLAVTLALHRSGQPQSINELRAE